MAKTNRKQNVESAQALSAAEVEKLVVNPSTDTAVSNGETESTDTQTEVVSSQPLTVVENTFDRVAFLEKHKGNKSAAIRELTSLNHKTAEIAKMLEIKYQHVRGVQMQVLGAKVGSAAAKPVEVMTVENAISLLLEKKVIDEEMAMELRAQVTRDNIDANVAGEEVSAEVE
jgi:hypothetical protein